METGPYTYPLTDRADIIKFLGEHQSYWPMNSNNGGFVLAWNIKLNGRILDTSGAAYRDEFGFEERFDKAWESYVERGDSMCFIASARTPPACTPMRSGPVYPGVEQGEWKFGINGRSGGWMILKDWPGPTRSAFPACPLSWHSRSDYQGWLELLDTVGGDDYLMLLYKGVVQLDQDLSRENCFKEVDYQYAFRRSQWEGEQIEAEEAQAREIEASRPDMYPQEN